MSFRFRMRVLLFVLLAALASCSGQQSTEQGGKVSVDIVNNPRSAEGMDENAAAEKPIMVFEDTVHNFGSVKEGELLTYNFSFENKGQSPLIITSASASCGCTVADYPHDPILPGKSATMKVTFNTDGKSGHQEKAITIQANTLRNIHMLYIQAEVGAKE